MSRVRELIAVNNYFTAMNPQVLKREALMFDRIAVPKLGSLMQFFRQLIGECPPEIIDFEWLFEQGILFEASHVANAEIQNEEYQNIDETAKAHMEEVKKLYKEYDLWQVFSELKEEDMAESAEKFKSILPSKILNFEKLVTSKEFREF